MPGLRRSLFSPATAFTLGVVTIFDSTLPRLEVGGVTLPMKRPGNDDALLFFTGSGRYSLDGPFYEQIVYTRPQQ